MRRIYRRRPCGGGGGSGGGGRDVTAPYRALLGPSLVALWDARVGVQLVGGEVNGWTDQIGGIVLTAPDSATRPSYAPDGTNLRARNVIGIANASNKRLGNIATPPLLGVGANPALFMVGRLTSVVAGNRWFVRVYDAPLSNAQFGLLMQFGTNMTCEFAGDSFSPAFADAASAHVFEQLYGSVHTVAIDGATIAAGASGAILSPTGRIGVGGNGSGTAGTVQDMAVAMVGIINPAPSAATRSRLLALVNADWGTPVPALPPLPASAVEFWHSEMGVTLVGGEVDAWRGQLLGTLASPRLSTARPVYGADGANFNGKPVIQCSILGGRYLKTATISPPLTAAGTKPYLFSVFRPRAVGSVLGDAYVSTSDGAVTAYSAGSFVVPSVLTNVAVWWYPAPPSPVSFGTAPAVASRYETTLNASGNVIIRVNGSAVTGGATATGNSPVATALVSFGGDPRDQRYTDSSHAFTLVCSSEPTASELAALTAWAQAYWGTP